MERLLPIKAGKSEGELPEEYLSRVDPTLGSLIRMVGPCRLIAKRRAPYEALVKSVTYQQLNGTAAAAIFGRLRALFAGKRFPSPADLLDTPDDTLRKAGLSRAKVAAIKDIAAKTLEEIVPGARAIARLSDAEILERLTVIRGVGPWTVEMLLMFTLGRPDVLPVTDYGVRKGFSLVHRWKDLPTPKELLEYGERWRPHRTVAAWYYWRALELPNNSGR